MVNRLLIVMCFPALNLVSTGVLAQGSDILAKYAIVSGGFGRTSGGQISPAVVSAGDASEVSDALKVAADGSGTKKVGIVWGGMARGLSCGPSKFGACTVEVVLPVAGLNLKDSSITVQGVVADMIYKAFSSVTPHAGPDGTRKSVANIACYLIGEGSGGALPKSLQCRIRDFEYSGTAQTLRQIVQSGFLTEAAAGQILKDSGVR